MFVFTQSNPLGMQGQIASTFGNLMNDMWRRDDRVIAPTDLKVIWNNKIMVKLSCSISESILLWINTMSWFGMCPNVIY